MISDVDDLSLDTPNAACLVGNFAGRAIADEVLPPVFLQVVPAEMLRDGLGLEVAKRVRPP